MSSQTSQFTSRQNNVAAMAKAFAHPARIAIIEYLLSSGICATHENVFDIGLPQSTMLLHLKELKKIGIIKGTIMGSKVSFCIDQAVWEQVQRSFQMLFSAYDHIADKEMCC